MIVWVLYNQGYLTQHYSRYKNFEREECIKRETLWTEAEIATLEAAVRVDMIWGTRKKKKERHWM